ncbi:snRNA-activating protein complex subunit 1b isoform 2-T2 [Polymixia lowei]
MRRAFSRQVLATAYRYFLPPFTFQIRVGGLYLLYGLYHSQLCTPNEKIRLALKDWKDVKKFERDAADAQHLDAVYILRHLLSQKAFHFTAMPAPLTYAVKRKAQSQSVCEAFMERASRLQELVSTDLLEEMSNVHEQYDQLKAVVFSPPGQPDSSVHLIREDIVPRLRSSVVDFNKWQKQSDSQHEDEEDSGEGTSEQQECSRRAELLASIKSKSYEHAIEASKSRRHRQIELTSNKTSLAANRVWQCRRKLSLKAKTNNNVQIKGILKNQTLKSTKVWRLSVPDTVPEEVPRKKKKFKW